MNYIEISPNSNISFQSFFVLQHCWKSVSSEITLKYSNLSLLSCTTKNCRVDSRFAPSQWETALLCNDVSHWLGASLASALPLMSGTDNSSPWSAANQIQIQSPYWHKLVKAQFKPTHNYKQDKAHDDVIKCKHFPCYWPFVRAIHRSPVDSPHKGQWHGALMFSLICAWKTVE